MNETNEKAYNETENFYEFLQRGGTWTLDQYIFELKRRGDL